MEEKPIDEIFTKEQLKKLKGFVNEHKGDNPLDLTKELKELMKPWADEMERKGVLSDYMAYAFAYMWSVNGSERTITKLKEVI